MVKYMKTVHKRKSKARSRRAPKRYKTNRKPGTGKGRRKVGRRKAIKRRY